MFYQRGNICQLFDIFRTQLFILANAGGLRSSGLWDPRLSVNAPLSRWPSPVAFAMLRSEVSESTS